jgi:hypothetical protein
MIASHSGSQPAYKPRIVDELRKARFLCVKPDRCEYLAQHSLFGPKVNDAFPSAARDIKEAGNCLAAESGTESGVHSTSDGDP